MGKVSEGEKVVLLEGIKGARGGGRGAVGDGGCKVVE